MKMTKSEAMMVAMNVIDDYMNISEELTDAQREKLTKAREVIESYKTTLDKPRTVSPKTAAKREAAAEAKKAETKAARAKQAAEIVPIFRKYLTVDRTAKELTEVAAQELPEGFTWHKTQTFLTREMAPELIRTERKKGGDVYRLA